MSANRPSSRVAASPNRSFSSASGGCSSSAPPGCSSSAPSGRFSAAAPDCPADLVISSLEMLRDAGKASIRRGQLDLVVEVKELQKLADVPRALGFINVMTRERGWILINRMEVERVSEHAAALKLRLDRLMRLDEDVLMTIMAPASPGEVVKALREARARVSSSFPDARSLADASAARAARAEAPCFSAPGGGSDSGGDGSSSDDDDGSSSNDDDGSSSDDDGGDDEVLHDNFQAVPVAEFVNAYADEAFATANADASQVFADEARDCANIARGVLTKCAMEILNQCRTLLDEPCNPNPPKLREAFVVDDAARDLAKRFADEKAMEATISRFWHQIEAKLHSPVVIADFYAILQQFDGI